MRVLADGPFSHPAAAASGRRRRVGAATAGKKIAREENFFLHAGATHPISQIDPARKKAGQSGAGLPPFVAFFFKARPEVHKAKAQVSTPRRVGA